MSDENLITKIELLEEQLENIERSGFFTEAEIDKYSIYIRSEIESLNSLLRPSQVNVLEIEVINPEILNQKAS